jgi:arginine decarboxylase
MVQFAIVGNRVPHKYFLTTGKGESDAGSKHLPAETGSYDAALNSAGIQDANVVKYTSVMPTEAKEISREEGTKAIRWGEVLESIMAQSNGTKGKHIGAAVMITSVHDPKGKYLGGFACEYSGEGTEDQAKQSLLESINGMIERRGYGKPINPKYGTDIKTTKGYKYHPGYHWIWSEMDVKKKHGTVLASMCFRSYKVPVIQIPSGPKGSKSKRRTRKKRKH